MGELRDNNGKLVTVVILLTPTSKKGNQLDVIKISSAQGRGHIESLFKKDNGELKIDERGWYMYKYKGEWYYVIASAINNPTLIDKMALPPCHTLFQFYVINNKLSCQLYQRSADAFLGVPFNIASYALLTMMVAQICNLELGDFVHTLGDAHIYSNHIEQVNKQLTREPRSLPKMIIHNKDAKKIEDFKFEDFELVDYNPHKGIKAEVAV